MTRQIDFAHKIQRVKYELKTTPISEEELIALLKKYKPKEIFLGEWSHKIPFYIISEYCEDGVFIFCNVFESKVPVKKPYEWILTDSKYSGFESCYFFTEAEEESQIKYPEYPPIHLYQNREVLTGSWFPNKEGERRLIAVDSDTKQSRVAFYYPTWENCTHSETYWFPTKDLQIVLKPIEELTKEQKEELHPDFNNTIHSLNPIQMSKLLAWGYNLNLLPRENYVLTTELKK